MPHEKLYPKLYDLFSGNQEWVREILFGLATDGEERRLCAEEIRSGNLDEQTAHALKLALLLTQPTYCANNRMVINAPYPN